MATSIFILGLMGLASLSSAAPTLNTRTVKPKRGLPFNDGALTKLFNIDGSQVSWMYNWDSATSGAATGLDYVPMLHSDLPENTGKWEANVNAGVKDGVTHVFSFNEPDQCGGGGACMQDVGRTVAAHKKWIQPLAESHPKLRLGAPAVTNGEKDPVTGAPMGIPYLKAFLAGCDGCKIDFVVAHWYDSAENVEYFKQHLKDVHEAAGGKPVWLTEFGVTTGDAEAFLRQVIPWMDGQSWIRRYAYQWAAPGVLVNDAGNGLSALGTAYATI